MKVKEQLEKKRLAYDDLGEIIRPGHKIFLSSGPATPVKTLTFILNETNKSFQDLEFIQLASLSDILFKDHLNSGRYRLKTFNVGESILKNFTIGHVDFIPTNISEIPYLIASGAIAIDTAIVQVSPPDKKGMVNLGLVNDISKIALAHAPVTIAEINPNVPVTSGTTSLSLDAFQYVLESDFPILEYQTRPYDEILDRIGYLLASLVEDGSTLSLGAGRIFQSVAAHLKAKKNLHIHSYVISDWIIDCIESGILEKKGPLNKSRHVYATAIVGSKKLYEYVNHNRQLTVIPFLQGRYQKEITKIKKLVSIINVNKIDVSGDMVLIPSSEYEVGRFDGKLNFSVAATHSRDGKPIVALKSVNRAGESNIVIRHSGPDALLRSTLGTTHYVVTEYGIANLFGKSIRERTIALIDIAHPSHRHKLIEEAKAAGFLYPDQIYDVESAIRYPYDLIRTMIFKKRMEVTFRPIKPTDEDLMRCFFYQFSDKAKYFRYFTRMYAMPHTHMQEYVNIDYQNTISLIGIIRRRGVEHIIAECRYAYSVHQNLYEMAFAVDEKYQGYGICSFMLRYLLEIAYKRGIKRLYAYVLPDNRAMIKVFTRSEFLSRRKDEKDSVSFEFQLDQNLMVDIPIF